MNQPNAINNIRNCMGYNPAEHLVEITYQDSNTKAMYLVVKERVRWFNQYCWEKGLEGLIDDSDVKFVPTLNGNGQFFATCSVYLQGKLIGKSSAACPLTGNYADDKIAAQSAATSAKGRALANAGFDISEIGTPTEDGDMYPCDTGIIVSGGRVGGFVNPMTAWLDERNRAKTGNGNVDEDDDVPFTFGGNNPPAPAPVPTPAPAPAQAPVQTTVPGYAPTPAPAPAPAPQRTRPAQPQRTMTREEALKFVIPTGQYSGKTMGELMGEDPGLVTFYAEKFRGRNTDLKLAAQTVLATQNA